MRSLGSRIAAVLVVVLVSGPAAAGGLKDAVARGERSEFARRYREARRLYDARDYAGAAREFQAAYALKRDPRLLLNAGNASLMGGRPDEALRLYDQCEQHDPPPDAALAVALKDARAVAEQQRRPVEPAPVAPAAAPVAPAVVSKGDPGRPALDPAGPGVAGRARPSPGPRRPIYKSPWLWVPLSLLVAAGVVTGVAVAATRDPLSGIRPENRFQFLISLGGRSW